MGNDLLRVAGTSALAGAVIALVVMGAYALRTAWVVTQGRRWYQFKQL